MTKPDENKKNNTKLSNSNDMVKMDKETQRELASLFRPDFKPTAWLEKVQSDRSRKKASTLSPPKK
jgi:hypothetical protein